MINFRDSKVDGQNTNNCFDSVWNILGLRVHGSSASQIQITLDVTRLSNDDLARLCALEQLKWGVVNEWVGRALITLWNDLGREELRMRTCTI
jgi:hypothetical protein